MKWLNIQSLTWTARNTLTRHHINSFLIRNVCEVVKNSLIRLSQCPRSPHHLLISRKSHKLIQPKSHKLLRQRPARAYQWQMMDVASTNMTLKRFTFAAFVGMRASRVHWQKKKEKKTHKREIAERIKPNIKKTFTKKQIFANFLFFHSREHFYFWWWWKRKIDNFVFFCSHYSHK